ncbi:hypothetical protein D3C77_699650 [compost metagenome]
MFFKRKMSKTMDTKRFKLVTLRKKKKEQLKLKLVMLKKQTPHLSATFAKFAVLIWQDMKLAKRSKLISSLKANLLT